MHSFGTFMNGIDGVYVEVMHVNLRDSVLSDKLCPNKPIICPSTYASHAPTEPQVLGMLMCTTDNLLTTRTAYATHSCLFVSSSPCTIIIATHHHTHTRCWPITRAPIRIIASQVTDYRITVTVTNLGSEVSLCPSCAAQSMLLSTSTFASSFSSCALIYRQGGKGRGNTH